MTNLLEEFADPDSAPSTPSHHDLSDDEYTKMMVRKEKEHKLARILRRNEFESKAEESDRLPEIPEGSCPSCYFCTIIKRIGPSVYCVCVNPSRLVEGMYYDHRIWVRSESDLACHKEPDSDAHDIPNLSMQTSAKMLERTSKTSEDEARNMMVDSLFKEEILAVQKHKALETLNKYRKDTPPLLKKKKKQEEPVVSERMTPFKKCENCYFCVENKIIGNSSWCHCTNLARSSDTSTASSWVRSRINARCWKKEEPLVS